MRSVRQGFGIVAATAVLVGAQLLGAGPANASSAAPAAAKGCSATAAGIPAGAHTATIGDVDGDGRADTEFITDGLRFGIRTASGATRSVNAGLPGPGVHSAWTARMHDGTVLATIDDQRDAEVFTFSSCSFHAVRNAQGDQYLFGLDGWSDYGTGVGCSATDRHLQGLQLKKHANGRSTIDRTRIVLSADRRTATNGHVFHGTTSHAATSSAVLRANGSFCGSIPKVHTDAE